MRLTRRFGRDERRLPEIGSRCLRRPRFASSCRRPRFVHFLGSPAICLSFHFFFPPLFPSPFSSPLSPRSRCEYPPPMRRGGPFRARRWPPCSVRGCAGGGERPGGSAGAAPGFPLRRGRACFGLSQFLHISLALAGGNCSAVARVLQEGIC